MCANKPSTAPKKSFKPSRWLVHTINSGCHANGVYTQLEPRNLFHMHTDDNNKRPDLLLINQPGFNNNRVAIDVSILLITLLTFCNLILHLPSHLHLLLYLLNINMTHLLHFHHLFILNDLDLLL